MAPLMKAPVGDTRAGRPRERARDRRASSRAHLAAQLGSLTPLCSWRKRALSRRDACDVRRSGEQLKTKLAERCCRGSSDAPEFCSHICAQQLAVKATPRFSSAQFGWCESVRLALR